MCVSSERPKVMIVDMGKLDFTTLYYVLYTNTAKYK